MRISACVIVAAVAACSKTEPPATVASGSTSPRAAASAPPAASPAPVASAEPPLALEAEPRTITTQGSTTATVRLRVPSGWKQRGASFDGPETGTLITPAVSVGATCGGICDKPSIAKVLADLPAKLKDSEARPNHNTGDPVKDAMRLDVATVGEGKLAGGGVYVAVKTTIPSDPAKYRGPNIAGYHAECAIPAADGSLYAYAIVRAPLSFGEEKLEVLLESCKSIALAK